MAREANQIDDVYVHNRGNCARIRRHVKYDSAQADESTGESQGTDESPETGADDDDYVIREWIMSTDTFDALWPKLQKSFENYKVILDLDEGYINVRVVPGDLDGAAASAFNYIFESWANHFQPVPVDNPSAPKSQRRQ